MRVQGVACALLALAAVAVVSAAKLTPKVDPPVIPGALPLSKGWIKGRSTFFGKPKVASGATVEGTCGYGDMSQTLFPRMNVGAVSLVHPGAECGSCIQVRCLQEDCTTTRPFVVQVVGSCGKSCSPNELQLPIDTYTSSLAPATLSEVLIEYRVVPCNPVGDIVVHIADVEQQTGGLLMTIAFISVLGPNDALTGVQLQSGGGSWQSVGKVQGNTGLWRGHVKGAAPFSVRLETTKNQVVEMPNVITKAKIGNYLSDVQLEGYPATPEVPGQKSLPRQDDLLAVLTGSSASELDKKLAATPAIQKLLLTDTVNSATTTTLQLNGTDIVMSADNAYVLQQITYEMLADVTTSAVTITKPLAGLGAASTRRMLRATKDASVTVGLLVATETDDEKTAVLATLRNTIKSGIFPARLNSAGLGVNFMTMDFRQPREPVVVSPASAGVSASVSQAAAPIEDASIVKTDNSFPLGGIIGIAVGGGLLLLLAVILIVCCARRQRRASTARKLNAACEAESDADFWHPNPAFEKPVYEKPFEKAEPSGGGLGAKLGGVFGVGKLTNSVFSDGDSKDSARGATTIDVHAESPREERSPTPSGVLGRSPSPSPLRWADVRATTANGAGGAALFDTPSPKTTHAPSPWTGMLDALRRSPNKTAQSPGTPPSARGQAANDSFSAPSPPAVAAPTIVTPNESAAAAGAAATLGAVAAGAVAAAAMVEHSAPSDASMGSQPSHLPDEAFCAGDALPSQSPLPLLTKAEKKPKAPKAKAVRSLWGGIFGGRHAGSEASDATAPLGTMTAVHVPSEAGSPEPRQPKAASPDADSPVAPAADPSPYSERPLASPFSERQNSLLLDSPVAAPPSPGTAMTVAPLAAGLQDGGDAAKEERSVRKQEVAAEPEPEPELPAVPQQQTVAVVEAPPAPVPQVEKPLPQRLVVSELEMAGDSQFVTAAAVTKEAQQMSAKIGEPAPQLASPKPAKQSPMAALKGFLRSPPRADKSAEQKSPEPQAVLTMAASPQPKQAASPKPAKAARSPKPVVLALSHQRSTSQLSEDSSPAKSPTPHEPKYATLDDRNLRAREEAALASPATRRVRIQEADGSVESPRSAGRNVRVPRAGVFDDSPCRSPAGSLSPDRPSHGMSRSQRGTPESASKVPRPYAGGRNDVMPFTAEELMLFKEAQSTASFAGSAGGDSRRSRRSNGSDASRISYHSRATSVASQRPRRDGGTASYAPNAANLQRVAAIPEGVREVLGLPSVPGGPLPGVPRPSSSRRAQRNLFEEALSETGSHGSRKRGSSDGKGHSRSAGPHSSPSQRHFK